MEVSFMDGNEAAYSACSIYNCSDVTYLPTDVAHVASSLACILLYCTRKHLIHVYDVRRRANAKKGNIQIGPNDISLTDKRKRIPSMPTRKIFICYLRFDSFIIMAYNLIIKMVMHVGTHVLLFSVNLSSIISIVK